MKLPLIILVLCLFFLASAPHTSFAIQAYSNSSVTVYCHNTTLNLTTDKSNYQYTETANMTVLINNTKNFNDLNEILLLELYGADGALYAYMGLDNATAPGNGTNETSYYRLLTDIAQGTYILRARVVPGFTYPSRNVTAHDCSLNGLAAQADVNITVTQEKPNPPGNLILILNKTVGPGFEDVTLNWTLSNSSNVFNYIIYKTDNYASGFNYSDPYATVANDVTDWTDSTADGVDQRYYVVRANGTSGLTDDNTYAVGKYNLKLYTGWNLISLPLLIWNSSTDDVIYTAVNADKWERFNGVTQSFERTDFFAGYGWAGDFGTAEVDRGYWYFSKKAGYQTTPYNNTIVGAVPTADRHETIYNRSWSMLGWTSINIKLADIALTTATNADKLERFNAITDSFERTDFFAGYGWAGDFGTVEPGRGYWYYSKNTVKYDWVYQP